VPDFSIPAEFAKRDDDQRIVWGWASVTEEGGRLIADAEGDVIEEPELTNMAHDFVSKSRAGGVLHIRDEKDNVVEIGEVVESAVFTKDMQRALGIDLGKVGWWIGVKVHSDLIWKMVKDGELKAFSIGGRGVREPI